MSEDDRYYQRGPRWRRKRGKTPEEFTGETDRIYESMTASEREKYYLHPNLWQPLVRYWRP